MLGFSASEIRPPLTKLSSHRSKISYIHSRQVFRGGGGGVKRSRKRQSKRRTREKLHESEAAAPSWKCPSKESWKKVFSFKATDIWLFSPYEIPRERRLALSLISSAKPRRTDCKGNEPRVLQKGEMIPSSSLGWQTKLFRTARGFLFTGPWMIPDHVYYLSFIRLNNKFLEQSIHFSIIQLDTSKIKRY